jgi:hypothetical protein
MELCEQRGCVGGQSMAFALCWVATELVFHKADISDIKANVWLAMETEC